MTDKPNNPFEKDVSSAYGAPMGRVNHLPIQGHSSKIYLRQAVMCDGVYDKGGAYWGSGDPLYCAYGYGGNGMEWQYFFRASNRREAVANVKHEFPRGKLARNF